MLCAFQITAVSTFSFNSSRSFKILIKLCTILGDGDTEMNKLNSLNSYTLSSNGGGKLIN